MRRTLPVPLTSFALILAACAESPTAAERPSADGPRFAITTTTTCEKEPGPTNTVESTSKNPAGKEPRGHQEPPQELSNRETKNCK